MDSDLRLCFLKGSALSGDALSGIAELLGITKDVYGEMLIHSPEKLDRLARRALGLEENAK